ncbi:M91 family zinc metallopeptidase [Segniliparus rugosus]|uniref:Uncharacterized protein n=1 Tax=Segniliparus rugosus (strain ATCC BAA-974 / DSM 45345 / CCUG 50838 / CIP 108380 / JCM 13579 / CDC 945) TaxID=679197 RepID=U1N4Z6_SEGRC|nr:M91 family zinc metallopeptidase [Segniliparus rugosus]ERG69254.1 hypothetical protein HMPREF9336_04145 [Segniliparus rugosus ATCC BAA-974]
MALTWEEIRDHDANAAAALLRALVQRGEEFPAHGAAVRRHEGVMAWGGPAREAANTTFEGNQAYANEAGSAATRLAAALSGNFDARSHLRDVVSNIIEDGAQLRFTFSDSGEIKDFYGSSGLWSELPADQKSLYLKLRDELPKRVDDALAQGQKLDEAAATALMGAAGLAVPSALNPEQTSAESLGDGLAFTRDQGMVVFKTGDGDDNVSVKQGTGGRLVVTVNGQSQTLSAQDSQNVLIQTQGGNDRVSVDPNVTVRVRFQLGDGNDTIDDQAIGGSYIDAGAGDDTVTLGGGHNTVYLGSGNNTVTGTKGADYINGGSGNNKINAGSGNSVIYAGTGNSTVNAGTGKNTIYAGSGQATINNQGGNDTIYAQAGTHVNEGSGHNQVVTIQPLEVPDNITVNGSPEFQRRMQDDFELLAASPDGQKMLQGLGHSGHTLLIDDGHLLNDGKVLYNNGYTAPAIGDQPVSNSNSDFYYDMKHDRPGPGTDAIISIDTTLTSLGDIAQGSTPDYHELNPTVVLYHEMAHAYDDMNGTMMPGDYGPKGKDPVDAQTFGWGQNLANAEREAVGLPVDWDNNPNTPEAPVPDYVHPHDVTENALREEMGLPDREHYLG